MLLAGLCLWFNAFVSREELFEGWRLATDFFQQALHNGGGPVPSTQALAQGIFALLAASTMWKLIAGGLFLRWAASGNIELPQAELMLRRRGR
jgi:hypothetical protein